MFENVEGRTDDGWRSHWYTNISPRCLRLRWAKNQIFWRKIYVCLPYLKFSDPLPETHLFFIWPYHKCLDKHGRTRSDCFWRSSLIRVFTVCHSEKHFVNSTPDKHHFYIFFFIWEQKEKSVQNFRTITVTLWYAIIILTRAFFQQFWEKAPGQNWEKWST